MTFPYADKFFRQFVTIPRVRMKMCITALDTAVLCGSNRGPELAKQISDSHVWLWPAVVCTQCDKLKRQQKQETKLQITVAFCSIHTACDKMALGFFCGK